MTHSTPHKFRRGLSAVGSSLLRTLNAVFRQKIYRLIATVDPRRGPLANASLEHVVADFDRAQQTMLGMIFFLANRGLTLVGPASKPTRLKSVLGQPKGGVSFEEAF